MSNDPIRIRCMEFLHSQLEKKAIPHIRPGMLEDLIALVQSVKAEEQAQQMAKRFEQIAREAGTAKEAQDE